jgi:putative esterase
MKFFSIVYVLMVICITGYAAPGKGVIKDFPVDTKLFKTTKEYFKGKVPKKVYVAYKKQKVPANWHANGLIPEKCIEYNPGEETALLYVPNDYNGKTAYGVYIHNSPGAKGIMPSQEWQNLMDKLKLVYISPNKTANKTPTWRRIVLAMDSLASVKKQYKINDKRIYVGGLSGGGHIAMMCQMIYPQYFQGAISHAAQSYLPIGGGTGHFPGLSMSDAKSKKRRKKYWAVISGDKDSNYKEILATSKDWKKQKFKYKFFDIKNMKHENAPSKALEDTLIWMGAGK